MTQSSSRLVPPHPMALARDQSALVVIDVQERLFLRERLAGSFDPEFPEVHVGPRQELSDEGMRICQWEVALRHVAAFADRRAAEQSALPTPDLHRKTSS